ncbi:hypothetical protein IWQ47_001417 [Aquimarina sp. EL_43]|uniref:DUF4230 domain-containing protein n=1 Tax=unclassified Aquimarina TaxID=2627091 RepID=UPI0018CA9AF2|nr:MULTISPECIES: DUF4230 domain-containing protein [unclassified Aquimarina]MBG6130500.1 hypothetical protein [Aquimarina sp. EL_35]MBG6149280.1 hypothetical protein [Aquimarina sp. EL_32]MBG6168346.1 hypothetical protein [Aquimarina sp. EL_43]
MELLFIGLLGGAILAYFIFARFSAAKNKSSVQTQSIVLKEKIKSVCKLVTVEGDFAEIYHYESVKEKFFKLLSGTKKALIIIEAKAYVGFDLSQIALESDTKNKRIILTHFPQPKLLTIETDFKYYDKKEGWLNPFTSGDLTDLNKEAKQFIKDKIPQSGLMESAKKEALTAISLMETLAGSIGWTLDYSALKIENNNKDAKQLE